MLTRAVPLPLEAFVIPGHDVARAAGLDLEAAGLRPVATPRHASALVVVGELPPELLRAAAVAYAQMPRPRAVIAVGAGDVAPLPPPVAAASPEQDGVSAAVAEARRRLRDGSWSAEAEPFAPGFLLPDEEDSNGNGGHGEHGGHDAHGGHGDHSGHSDHGGHGGDDHGGDHGDHGGDHGDHDDHGGDHGDHGGGGFMSMVMMTKDLPRSADGLAMDRAETPFGPFFPGLPSGLDLGLVLDGDTVVGAEVGRESASRGVESGLRGDLAGLPDRLARLDPLAPVSYRWLAVRAIESLDPNGGGEEAVTGHRVAAVERERAASHLNWLASFGHLLGHAWLARSASRLQREVRACRDEDRLRALEAEVERFLRRVRKAPLLSRRLRGLGRLTREDVEVATGPVARASGLERDGRRDDPAYSSLPFEPVVREGGDALARMEVRMEEIRRSLALVRTVGPAATVEARKLAPASEDEVPLHIRGTRTETPRGIAKLRLKTEGRSATGARLDPPSRTNLLLVEHLVAGLELADALVAVASLDLSAWEAAE